MRASELKIGHVYVVRNWSSNRFAMFTGFTEFAVNYGAKPRKAAKLVWLSDSGKQQYADTKQLSAIQYEYADSIEAFQNNQRIAEAKAAVRKAEQAVKAAEFDAEKLTLQKQLAELLGEQALSVDFGARNGKPTAILTLELVNALANASKQLVG